MDKSLKQTKTVSLINKSEKFEFEDFIGIQELSKRLQIPVKTIYKWVSEFAVTGFPSHKIGRHLRFRLSEIEEWIQKYL